MDVSKSILVELKGKTPQKPILLKKKAPPPPPPPIFPKPNFKRKPPERPPAPKVDLMDVNYVEESKPKEPMYARVKKDSIRPDR